MMEGGSQDGTLKQDSKSGRSIPSSEHHNILMKLVSWEEAYLQGDLQLHPNSNWTPPRMVSGGTNHEAHT